MSDSRLKCAEAFLAEAVFRSRSRQAAFTQTTEAADGGRCGLGEKAAVELDLGTRGAELFQALWPEGLPEESLPGVREGLRAWVKRQDALDRARNHFMKGFRKEHGLDRSAYSEEQQRLWRAGLDEVNGSEDEERHAAARRLLEI